MWEELEFPWQIALEEAWAAYCAGSLPIGAVVTDAAGALLSRGRNRIHENTAPAALIAGSPLAHAEINALLALDYPFIDRHNCHIYTVTEPCPLCMGAIYVTGIYNIHYASRDPWAGSTDLLGKTPYLSRKPVQVFHPSDPDLEAVIVSLFVEYDALKDTGPSTSVIQSIATFAPDAVALGQSMAATGVLRRLRAMNTSAKEMVETIVSHLP
jgi:tRNA(adenine34) deaminase